MRTLESTVQVGDTVKFFTRWMFGVVVTGRVVVVNHDGTVATVNAHGGGASWTEKVHVVNIVK